MLLVAIGFWLVPEYQDKQRAKNELIPAIQKLANENFRAPTKAFDMALEAEKSIADDSALIKLWPQVSTLVSIGGEPAGG